MENIVVLVKLAIMQFVAIYYHTPYNIRSDFRCTTFIAMLVATCYLEMYKSIKSIHAKYVLAPLLLEFSYPYIATTFCLLL